MARRKTKPESGVTIAPSNDFYKEPETTEVETVQTTETAETKPTIIGVVSNCKKLNVRKLPNSNAPVKTVLDEGTEVTIDEDKSNDNYYAVKCGRLSGYCTKQFITLK